MLKVALLIYHYFPYGGQQRDFMQIARRCVQAGHEVHVYCLKWQGDVPDGLHVHVVPVSALLRHVCYQRFTEWTQDVLRKNPVDVVMGFSKMPGLDIYFAADPCFAARMHKPSQRALRLLPRYQHFLRYERAVFAADSNTEVLLLSPQQQQDFARFYPHCQARLHRVPPGLSPDRVMNVENADVRLNARRMLGVADDALLLLQIGSGFRIKGIDRSLRAIAALPAAVRARVQYRVAGQGSANKYLRLARRLGIAAQVEFIGARDDVPDLLQAADLLLHPAYHESAGYTLLEAIVNGVPVLTTATCGYAFHVLDARAGMVSPSPFCQADLNARLHEMLISSDRSVWRQNGLQYAEKVNLTGMADEALTHIQACAESRRAHT